MPIVFGAIAAAGAVGSFISQIMGGGAKRDAMYAGAHLTDVESDFTKQQTDEQVRRFQMESEQRVGAAQAGAGASGFASMYGGGSSLNKYATALGAELGKEADWMHFAGYKTAEFQTRAAQIQRQSADAGLWGDALSGVAGLLGSAGKIGQTMFGYGGGSGGGFMEPWMANSPMGGASGT